MLQIYWIKASLSHPRWKCLRAQHFRVLGFPDRYKIFMIWLLYFSFIPFITCKLARTLYIRMSIFTLNSLILQQSYMVWNKNWDGHQKKLASSFKLSSNIWDSWLKITGGFWDFAFASPITEKCSDERIIGTSISGSNMWPANKVATVKDLFVVYTTVSDVVAAYFAFGECCSFWSLLSITNILAFTKV